MLASYNSLVPRGLIFANQLWQKNMQVIIYLVLASISIVYTKDENIIIKDPKRQFGDINGPHKDGELANLKQGILESDAFSSEHVSTAQSHLKIVSKIS